jgi:hypothetical protein
MANFTRSSGQSFPGEIWSSRPNRVGQVPSAKQRRRKFTGPQHSPSVRLPCLLQEVRMVNLRRLAAATAACVATFSSAPVQAASLACDQEIQYGSNPVRWWALQYECGESHPNQGCYREIGGTEYLAFNCTSNTPSGQCDAGGCVDSK